MAVGEEVHLYKSPIGKALNNTVSPFVKYHLSTIVTRFLVKPYNCAKIYDQVTIKLPRMSSFYNENKRNLRKKKDDIRFKIALTSSSVTAVTRRQLSKTYTRFHNEPNSLTARNTSAHLEHTFDT